MMDIGIATATQPTITTSPSHPHPHPNPHPHVLIFPLPAQGHVNSMLKLAELLALSGQFKLTFLNSQHNHRLLLRHTDIESRFSNYSDFHFRTFSDGLPEIHSRSGNLFMEMFEALKTTGKQSFRDLLADIQPPVDCIIGDGILGFAFDVAHEFQIPMIAFRTVSACAVWVYYNIPEMIEAGELPIKGDGDMDQLINAVPSMEGFLRRRDLPSFCQAADVSDQNFQLVSVLTRRCTEARGLILNTFEDLEGPTLAQIRTRCPKIYTIGPLHAHLKNHLTAAASGNSLFEVDRSCLDWLDKQPTESVMYVSFGSIATLSRQQLLEFWAGLVNTKKRFLWVIRPNLVAQDEEDVENFVPHEILQGTKERGCMVGWAPQEEVLAHEAVGGFLTHSGWNSTLESIVEGVPMICWSFFADQQVNSRFVTQVWKLGLDMKDSCDRWIVERMVNDLMVERRGEFMESAARMAKLAKQSVSVGGSSYCNLEQLIEDIRLMST